MIHVHRNEDRGRTRLGWLDSRHSFSFGGWYDSKRMGFRALRVINEDQVAPRAGFGAHPHREMEILTVVLDGALDHRDSQGHGSVIQRGTVQRMSAGTGIVHSEMNASDRDPVRFIQIWIEPAERGIAPGYEERKLGWDDSPGKLQLLASPEGRVGSLHIHQDARLWGGALPRGSEVRLPMETDRHAWVQLVSGAIRLGEEELTAGDGAALSDEAELAIIALDDAELLIFDLA